MPDFVPTLMLGLVASAFVFEHWRKKVAGDHYRWWSKEKMPSELRQAKIALNEQDVAMVAPLALYGRLDQAYRRRDGVLVLVDTKSRKRHVTYVSDIIQLSSYAVCMEAMYGNGTVASHGYVRTVIPDTRGTEGSVKYHRVHLMSLPELARLHSRCSKIKQGEINPRCLCGGRLH